MSMFMKIQYVNGDVTAKKYENWVEIESLLFESFRHMDIKIGQTQNRSNAETKIKHATIVKRIDSSSNALFQNLMSPTSFGQVEIHVCTTDKNLDPYLKFTLNNVMVARQEEIIVQGIHPMEVLDLSFSKLQRTYINRGPNSKSGSPNITGFDLATGQLS